ncbi:hypothetical protein ACG1VR_08950 [Cedecea davisae]
MDWSPITGGLRGMLPSESKSCQHF